MYLYKFIFNIYLRFNIILNVSNFIILYPAFYRKKICTEAQKVFSVILLYTTLSDIMSYFAPLLERSFCQLRRQVGYNQKPIFRFAKNSKIQTSISFIKLSWLENLTNFSTILINKQFEVKCLTLNIVQLCNRFWWMTRAEKNILSINKYHSNYSIITKPNLT